MSVSARPASASRGAAPTAPDGPVRVLAPLSWEARGARAGAPWAEVVRVGMGPRRTARWAAGASAPHATLPTPAATLVAGFGGALRAGLAPGDVVLASELRGPDGTVTPVSDPTILAGVLRRGGLRVHVGPVACAERIVRGAARGRLAADGALVAEMESTWLAPAAGRRPFLVLRVVLDGPERELTRPWRTVGGFLAARRALRRALTLAGEWAPALGPRELVLAAPRASCAGVDRAVEIVRATLRSRGAPVYVRRQIVHNDHVVRELEALGAVFVREVDEVPRGASLVFAAHGVSPAVRAQADARSLDVVDATCPLVAKVHGEARRFAEAGREIVLIGHAEHEEVEGTLGEAPGHIRVIAHAEEVAGLRVQDPARVAWLSQTTLAVDETQEVVGALRERFPEIVGPPSADICYATQNRQDAVRALAEDCDLVLVVGAANSSNSRRLVEVAGRAGVEALLVGEASEIPPQRLLGARRIGISAGASAPESLVRGVIAAVAGLGAVNVNERTVATEKTHFKLPPEVNRQRSQ